MSKRKSSSASNVDEEPAPISPAKSIVEETEEKAPATFASLGVCEELLVAIEALGWKNPTRIQEEALPWAFQKRDIIALAETGSGKTGAFALPIIQALLEKPQRMFAIALAPTRELCVQIDEQFRALGSSVGLETAVILGGMDMVQQAMALAKNPHIVVGTPGRLVDHLENTKGFNLKRIQYLVMDEADRLLSMDFEEALDKILEASNPDRQTFLFSATMTSKVSKLQRASLHKPVKCEVSTKYDTARTLVQNFMLIPFKYKQTYLAALLKLNQKQTVIVFVETCLNAQRTTAMLRKLGFSACCLHGQLNQAQRLGALNQFKAGKHRVLLATDVASRGLDIPSVDMVINYDIPKNSKDYIHRVGRTARAGRSGRSITMVTQYDIEAFQRVEHLLGQKLDKYEDLTEADALKHHETVLEAMRQTHLEQKEKEQTLKEVLEKGGNKKKMQKLTQKLGKGGSKKQRK